MRAICGELWLLNACQSGAVGKDLEASAATPLLRNGRQPIQTLTAALRHQWTQWLFLLSPTGCPTRRCKTSPARSSVGSSRCATMSPVAPITPAQNCTSP